MAKKKITTEEYVLFGECRAGILSRRAFVWHHQHRHGCDIGVFTMTVSVRKKLSWVPDDKVVIDALQIDFPTASDDEMFEVLPAGECACLPWVKA